MSLYQAIEERQSIRRYDNAPLSPKMQQKVQDLIHQLPRWEHTSIQWVWVPSGAALLPHMNRIARVAAPHYLLIIGPRNEDSLLAAGFQGEHLVLGLHQAGLGSCYLGNAINQKAAQAFLKRPLPGEVLLTLALGTSAKDQALTRPSSLAKRRPLDSFLLEGTPTKAQRLILQAARLAPTGMNSQTFRFKVRPDALLLYRELLFRMHSRFFRDLTTVDMGIVLCHMALAAREVGIDPHFIHEPIAPGNPEYIKTLPMI
ncbi:hypothetical protein ABB02_01822 [Clostridiaceae bacterium JG1575]|nr:hypothetical protein ABB02_01822 [Clostridiaceae bacterium JG1575]